MKLFDYLHLIGWIDRETMGEGPQAPLHRLANLLDLDLSIELSGILDGEAIDQPVQEADLGPLIAPSVQLDLACRDTQQKFNLALANWERGRYRVIHGQRVGELLTQAGFGTIEKADERWKRTGRLMWSSTQEFVETHFKRARMKIRMASEAFRSNTDQWSDPLIALVGLDNLLLKAKLRQTEMLSTWLVRVAHQEFLKQWNEQRPPLETQEALAILIDNTSPSGWTGTFIEQFGHAFTCLLSMEMEASTVLSRALGVYPQDD